MSYQDDEDFKNARIIYLSLDDIINDLHEKVSKTESVSEKIYLLKKLADCIVESDSCLDKMIKDFPDYYTDKKTSLDTILEKTKEYLRATLGLITLLENNGSN